MKTLKMTRYFLEEIARSVAIFYGVILAVMTFLIVLSKINGLNTSSSGLQFSSVVFLFVMGLNIFKEGFYFSQANNLSRKTLYRGLLFSAPPISLFMTVVDYAVYRIFNLFQPSPSTFDMLYGGTDALDVWKDIGNVSLRSWYPPNDLGTILSSFLWSFVFYCMVYVLGLFITMMVYRSSTLVRTLLGGGAILAIVLVTTCAPMLPSAFLEAVSRFLSAIFSNACAASLSFLAIALLLAGGCFLFVRRAVVKR